MKKDFFQYVFGFNTIKTKILLHSIMWYKWFLFYIWGLRMKKLLACLLISSCMIVYADDNALYVGAAAGAAWNNIQTPDAAFRLDGGIDFTPSWAIEAGTTGLTQSGGTPNQSMQYYDLSVKGTWPVTEPFNIFLQLGGAYGSPGVTSSNAPSSFLTAEWNVLTAVGVGFNLSPQTSLNLTDYYYYVGATTQGNTNVILGGVKYSF